MLIWADFGPPDRLHRVDHRVNEKARESICTVVSRRSGQNLRKIFADALDYDPFENFRRPSFFAKNRSKSAILGRTFFFVDDDFFSAGDIFRLRA